jgi:signal peptide peptidase SppA
MNRDDLMAIMPEALVNPDSRPAPAPSSESSRTGGVVQILPLFGTISQRWGRGTTTENFTRMFRAAMADSNTKGIVINVDSPGGTIYGVDELATEIFKARGDKRIVSIANSLSASAAYWIASAADEFNVTPGGEVGSIGIVATHKDRSRALEQDGIKTTLIFGGRFKTEESEFAPLSNEAKAAMKARVDEYYSMFVNTAARNRGTTPTRVHTTYGRGRTLGAAEALRAGMVDRIATLDQVLSKLGVTSPARMAAGGI